MWWRRYLSTRLLCMKPQQCFTRPSSVWTSFHPLLLLWMRRCIASVSGFRVCEQVWSGPLQGPHQSAATLHTHSGAGQRTAGLPADAEPVRRRLHLRPLRRAAGRASWAAEPAGELRQYLQRHILAACFSSLVQNVCLSFYLFSFVFTFSKHQSLEIFSLGWLL